MSKAKDLEDCKESAPSKLRGRFDFFFQAEVKECMEKKGYTYVGTGVRNDDKDDEKAWK